MKCSKCGYEIPDNAMFCPKCGAMQDTKADNESGIYCPFCGKKTPSDSIYCEECGKYIIHSNREKKRKRDRRKLFLLISAAVIVPVIIAIFAFKEELISITLNHNSDKPYIKEIGDEDIVREGDTIYVDSQILVNLADGASKSDFEKLVKKEGGVIVGEIPISNTFQIEYPNGKSKKELDEIVAVLEKEPQVEMAILHYAYMEQYESFDYTHDSWEPSDGNKPRNTFFDTKQKWDSLNPEGPNWWAEAIWLSGVQHIDWDFKEVKIGIIDSMFDTTHPDLSGAFAIPPYQNPKHVEQIYKNLLEQKKEQDKEGREAVNNRIANCSHGTHVAGLLGARINSGDDENKKFGIVGVAPNAQLYGYSILSDDKAHDYFGLIESQYAISLLLQEGVKAINISMGDNDLALIMFHKRRSEGRTSENSAIIKQFENTRNFLSGFIADCINHHYDFLIFNSAGNCNNMKIVPASKEDEDDPAITVIDGYRLYDSNRDSQKTAEVETVEGVSCTDSTLFSTNDIVRKSIIFVGAMDRLDNGDKKIKPWQHSCADADLMAPGVDILSDLPNKELGYKTGTSMAAPIATGVAALVWGVNPELKASEVRDILINQAQRPFSCVFEYMGVTLKVDSDVPMINSFDAVNAALAYRSKDKSVKREEGNKEPKNNESEDSKSGYAVLMGVLSEKSQDSVSIDYNKDQYLNVIVEDENGSQQEDIYELKDGGFLFFLKPGEYKISVYSTYYSLYEENISVKQGEVLYKEIKLTPNDDAKEIINDEESKKIINDYLNQKEFMYGRTCSYNVRREGEDFRKSWDGLQPNMYLGYNIEDYDEDGNSELLMLKVTEDDRLLLEMYEVFNGQVTLSDSMYLDNDSPYGAFQLPHGRDQIGNLCGIVSCFVQGPMHVIYIQVTDAVHLLGEGTGVSIASVMYKDDMFTGYEAFRVEGSDPESLIDEYNGRLLNMGVPNPDFESIFVRFALLSDCFDGEINEFLHAEQCTVNILSEDTIMHTSTEMMFLNRGEKPTREERLSSEPIQNRKDISLTIEDFEKGFQMEHEEFIGIYGEPDSSETYHYSSGETYQFTYENVTMQGVNGKMVCWSSGRVWNVEWTAYEPNENLYDNLIAELSAFTESSDKYEMKESLDHNVGMLYIAFGGDEKVVISPLPSIEWSLVDSTC